MKSKLKIERGFTLIEILVVIAIIGLLSLIVFASFDDSKKKARDSARHADIQQLAAALQTYGVTYGEYPSDLADLVSVGLLFSIPTDPLNDGDNVYTYENSCASPSVTGDTQYYRLWTIGEREQEATVAGWTDSKTIGATSCADPQ